MSLGATVGGLRSDRLRRRGPALADPVISSLSNVVVFMLVARAFDAPEPVGAFSLAMVAYNLAVGTSRAVISEPFMSVYSAASEQERRALVGGLQATTVVIGLVAAAIVWVISLLAGGMSGSALAALAAIMPVLLVQDVWRYIFVIRQPKRTVAVDLIWLAFVLAAFPFIPADAGVSWYVLFWGAGAGVGALTGLLLHGGLGGGPVNPFRWLVTHRAMAWRFFGEFQIARGVFELSLALLAAVAGLAALGAVKASLVFYGFLSNLNGGLQLALIPEGVRLRERRDRLRDLMSTVALATAALALVWTVVGLVLPDRIGSFAFGSTWDEGKPLLLPMGLAMVARGLKHGGFLGLRSLADARGSLRARLVTAPYEIICPIVGAVLNGATGFVVGFAVSQFVAAFLWSSEFEISLQRSGRHFARSSMAKSRAPAHTMAGLQRTDLGPARGEDV